MKTIFEKLMGLFLVSIANLGFAGIVEQMDFVAQPVVNLKQGNITGCGYRLIGSKFNNNANQKSYAVDFSFNLYLPGTALVKAGFLEFDINSINENKPPKPVPIKMFWIKSSGAKATNPGSSKIIESDSPLGYLLYRPDVEGVVPLFGAVYDKEQVMVGYRRANEDFDRIFNGTISLEDVEVKQVQDCVVELLSNMDKL